MFALSGSSTCMPHNPHSPISSGILLLQPSIVWLFYYYCIVFLYFVHTHTFHPHRLVGSHAPTFCVCFYIWFLHTTFYLLYIPTVLLLPSLFTADLPSTFSTCLPYLLHMVLVLLLTLLLFVFCILFIGLDMTCLLVYLVVFIFVRCSFWFSPFSIRISLFLVWFHAFVLFTFAF